MEVESIPVSRIPGDETSSGIREDLGPDGEIKLASASADAEDYGDQQQWDGQENDKCNLIINYLPHEIDDATLKTLFMEHGEILVAKVVKDKATKKSLGYGFVKFLKEEDSIAAIELKNGFMMGHKKLKVSIARPPSLEIRNCKLYITNLPKEYSDREVVDLFAQFGEIIECRVLKDRNAKTNKGVAFVQFNLKNQANNALSLNGYRPPGHDRHLVVKYAEDQHRKKERRGQPLGVGVVGMMGMGTGLSKQDPRDPYFYARNRVPNMYNNQSGNMQMVHSQVGNQVYLPATSVVYSPRVGGKTSISSGMSPTMSPQGGSMDWFGQMPQMVYDTSNVMGAHNQQMHNQAISYEQMSMEHMMVNNQQQQQRGGGAQSGTVYMRSPRSSQEPGYSGSVTLVIQSLPPHADVALLHDLCAPYGRILSAQIDVDTTSIPQDGSKGVCSGRGRVQMAGLAQAQYACQALNGAIIFEGGRPLQVSIASYSGGARSAEQQQQQAAR